MENALLIIDKVTDILIDNTHIHTISFDYETEQVIVTCDLKKIENVINTIDFDEQKIKINYQQGPPIIDFIGDIKKEPPLEFDVTLGIKGGMACGIKGDNFYGTVTTTVGTFNYQAGNLRCTERPTIVSNNHVIVSSAGKKIWAGNINNEVANRTCYIPFNRHDIHVDLALGKLDSFSYNTAGQIVQIGEWQNIVRVSVGSAIKKFGARTGYRTGNVMKITNIRVSGRWFRHIYETTRDFSCPGDSGSAVLDNSNNWIGVLSWGENLGENTCSKHPKGYFWAVDSRSQFFKENYLEITEIQKMTPNTEV